MLYFNNLVALAVEATARVGGDVLVTNVEEHLKGIDDLKSCTKSEKDSKERIRQRSFQIKHVVFATKGGEGEYK